MIDKLKNGQAFLCTKTVCANPAYYITDIYKDDQLIKKAGEKRDDVICFQMGKIYFVDKHHYLVDDRGIHKNYAWFKDNFERSPENDKVINKKPFLGVRKNEAKLKNNL